MTPPNITAALRGKSGDILRRNRRYRWRTLPMAKERHTNFSGATASTYTIPSTAAVDAGNYTVVLSSQCGRITSVTSAIATLTINNPPAISTQPFAQTKCEHDNVTFTVAAPAPALAINGRSLASQSAALQTASYSLTNISQSDPATIR